MTIAVTTAVTRPWEDFAYGDAPRADCAWGLDTGWPRLEGDGETDIAVIGGGYAGLSAALHLARAGEAVTVLEAKSPGWGASGRNGGFCCLGGALHDHSTLTRRYGEGQAAEWIEAEKQAIALVEALIAAHGIDVARHSEGEVVLAHAPRVYRGFAADKAHHEAHGIATEILPPEALAECGLRAAGIHGGLHVKLGFGLDPGAYAASLARAAAGAGADIRGESPVSGIRREAGGYRLTTPRASLTARRVLIATNGYSSDDVPRWLAGRFLPMQSSVMVTRPITAEEQAAQGWSSDLMAYDSRSLLHYVRLMPDGRFLFGMRGAMRSNAAHEARVVRRIRQHFEAMFPAWRGVETAHFWSGFVNFSRSGLPFVGPIPDMPGAFAAMGWHGNGVAMASYGGALVADVIRGRTPARPYPEIMRRPLARFPLGRHRRWLLTAATPLLALRDAV